MCHVLLVLRASPSGAHGTSFLASFDDLEQDLIDVGNHDRQQTNVSETCIATQSMDLSSPDGKAVSGHTVKKKAHGTNMLHYASARFLQKSFQAGMLLYMALLDHRDRQLPGEPSMPNSRLKG